MNQTICLKLKKNSYRSPVNEQTVETCEISTLYNVQWQAIPLLRSTVFK